MTYYILEHTYNHENVFATKVYKNKQAAINDLTTQFNEVMDRTGADILFDGDIYDEGIYADIVYNNDDIEEWKVIEAVSVDE